MADNPQYAVRSLRKVFSNELYYDVSLLGLGPRHTCVSEDDQQVGANLYGAKNRFVKEVTEYHFSAH